MVFGKCPDVSLKQAHEGYAEARKLLANGVAWTVQGCGMTRGVGRFTIALGLERNFSKRGRLERYAAERP